MLLNALDPDLYTKCVRSGSNHGKSFCNPLVAIALGLALRNQKTIALEQQHAKGYASLPAITGKKVTHL